MTNVFSWELIVRSYEVAADGFVDPVYYIHYLEETALRASAAVGYDNNWFEENGYAWIIHKWMVRYSKPAQYGDTLVIRSWVSDFQRVQSHREYEIRHNNTRVVRARANWVFVEREAMRPARLFDAFYEAYQPSNEVKEDLGTRLINASPVNTPHKFVRERRIQHYEMDRMQHVNNGHYFRWVTEAHLDIMSQLERPLSRILSHEMTYKRSATKHDPIKLISWHHETTADREGWLYEIRHAKTDALIAQDYITLATAPES